ncbi:MAG TPA: MBL fold metallo-hydrolase [Elusimicrobiota bacterium]|nr:MBL fold metallo-hydrolase [Elusimicrobiota bacterium]
MTHYPRPIEGDVFFCGFSSEKSFGAQSYLIRRSDGNWMTDAPRFVPELAERIEELGGLRWIFLTHRDDVADAALYAERFGARRIIHEADLAAQPGAEVVLRGTRPSSPAPGFTIIPVPGHTRGHCVLLYEDRFLFAGDHLEGDARTGRLGAFRDYCWYDWAEQTRSMERLLDYRFDWVLPGHGGRLHLPAESMREQLAALVERMKVKDARAI